MKLKSFMLFVVNNLLIQYIANGFINGQYSHYCVNVLDLSYKKKNTNSGHLSEMVVNFSFSTDVKNLRSGPGITPLSISDLLLGEVVRLTTIP